MKPIIASLRHYLRSKVRLYRNLTLLGLNALGIASTAHASTADLIVTEIQSNQASTGVNDYWELTNVGTTSMDISGYKWIDNAHTTTGAVVIPSGTTIAAGESVIFTAVAPATFRSWWGIPNTVQVINGTGTVPGLGSSDAVTLYTDANVEVFFFNYAAGGFTRSDGTASLGGHAGASAAPAAGGSATKALVFDPNFGTANRRYTAATVGTFGAVASPLNAADIGSPGSTPIYPTVSIGNASIAEGDSGTVTLNLPVTRTDVATAFSIDYAVTGGTATSGTDYATLASGTLTFTAAGAATQNIAIIINTDTTGEPDETVIVTLSNLVNTTGSTLLSTATGTGTILNDDPFLPSFTTSPASVSISNGSTATLTVAASGPPAPTFQWYLGTSGDTSTPVATGSSFTTPQLAATTSYWVRATNTAGSTDSATAVVTVINSPVYTSSNLDVLVRNTDTWNSTGVTINGTQFVNLGLQGVGRVAASAKDPATGESLGSISDMQVTGWTKNANGSYSGVFSFLPDRGYNSGAIFSNYAARINAFSFTFTPYTATAPTAAQDQIALTFTGSTRFTYDHDGNAATAPIYTTGMATDTASGATLAVFGSNPVPVVAASTTQSDGSVTNRLTVDAEGLVLDKRAGKAGSGWVSDEYGASIYHFTASKQLDGQVLLPQALVPHSAGNVNFVGTPATGRRDNQGVEALSQSPDGTRLFAMMQSATIQDTGTGNQGRYNTRVLVYDISSNDLPTAPIAQYVLQLPRVDDTGLTTNGTTVNRNGAQSSLFALNNHQFLVLSRDGNGRGSSGAPVFKSILLADLASATNINGTYDADGNAVAPAGVLTAGVTAVSWTQALNLIGGLGTTATEVAKFGLNLNTAPGDINSICEKWEALSLVSANDAANPNDYFLFVGNDNDFLSSTGKYLDASGTLQNYDSGLENDTLVLAYRVRMTGSDNQAPFVANALVDQMASNLAPLAYTFAANTFIDPEASTLTYTATKSDDTALPAWLSFNATTRTFSGAPGAGDVGTVSVKVTATDSGTPALFASATFSLSTSFTPASFAFTSATSSVVEDAGNATLSITRTGDLAATSINFSTSDGTALAGTDYTALTAQAVAFAANQTTATVNVAVTNRSGIRASRDFTATLSGGLTNAPATTTVTITESESSFAFSAATASISEGAGSVALTINRTGRTDVASNVSVSTANGTGIAGTDYTALSSATVAFAANDLSKTVSVAVINRPGTRASRTFTATLSVAAAPLLAGTPATATVTITEADTFNSMTGPSSSRTPYIQPLSNNWQVTSLISVGDQVPNSRGFGNYEMAGIPDGVGAFDNGDGTFTMLVNHEIGSTLGVTRSHGAIGGFVSQWIISKSTLQVLSGSDLIVSVFGWDAANQASSVNTGTFAFNRPCSADLPAVTAFYNAATGKGTQQRIFMNGEESGTNGWAMANVVTGPSAGRTYILGKFNLATNGSGISAVGGWENLLANPYAQDKTIVIGNNDGGTGIMSNSVAVYVGTKTNVGTEADKAGLTNGTLKFINVAGNALELANATTRATNITSGTRFTLSGTASTTFRRPEDGAWDPTNPTRFYFVTTDQLDQVNDAIGAQVGRTRLWRLTFDDITNPDAGGIIDLLIEGGDVAGANGRPANDANMWDNLAVTADGKVILCEDVGGAAHNGKVWFYDPATNAMVKIFKHDPARFGDLVAGVTTAATAPFNNDEETSGVIDVTSIFGGNAATGERSFLIVDQAHYNSGISAANVEGGQLLLIKQSASFLGIAAGDADSSSATLWAASNKTTTGLSINVQVSTTSAFNTPTTVASSTPTAANSWTSKVNVTGLNPATSYFYRFVEVATGEISATGKFKTAPATNTAAPLHFAFSGDNDGLVRPYALASVIPAQNLDFYINLGDVLYENASNVAGNNGASWLNSPSVTLSSDSLSFNGVPRAFIPAGTPFATQVQLKADYDKKYRENFLPINLGGQNALQSLYAAQGNYTTWDNHELGNRKYIDGGAPAGGSVGGAAGTDMATGRGVDARDNGAGNVGNVNDVNTSTTDIMNRATGWQVLRDVFLNWQPIADRGTISAPTDPRTDGTKKLYNAQAWGKNAIYVNTDARSYRDIRLKTATGSADDTGTRADNPNRTYLGATQFAWLKQTLLDAHNAGTTWKFVSISDPIDQIGPIGGNLTLANLPSFGTGSTYQPVNADGGKAYMGGYRAERNALLKYIADNHITNVVFLSTDDHQNRINELTYSPTNALSTQSSYVKVPYCFSIVCGPLGATGPDLITNHTFAMAQQLANSLSTAQTAAGVEPLGLIGYPGLKNLTRVGHPTAATAPEPVDFYSPDTFNFTTLDVSADGKTLTVSSVGMEATAQNAALEYANGPQAQTIFSFQVDAVSNVADLASLNISGVTTTPVFDAATASYTASVPGNTVAVTLTPTAAPGATITVNGSALVSGSASVPVNVGSNTITVLVTAQDGGTTKTYTITVTRAAAPSYAFAAATSSVTDAAGSAALAITRTGDTTVATTVSISTANGTGSAGTDYTALSSQTVSFAANATTATVSVPVLYRSGINGARTFTATLSNPSTGCLVGTPATATVTITDADSTSAIAGPSSSASPYVLPIDSNWQTRSILTVGDSVGGYQMAGIPDGLGAYDNNDGTFTLLMHHEIGSTLGVARAHGGIGAFVSEWVINKSTLAVVSGSDLMRNVYNWNATTQASDALTSTLAFNRFCSADLPAPSAFYNAATGLGTTARLFMGGEEGGANGWAMAHVASGPNKGRSYVLGKFNLSTNGSGLTGVGAWETLCANPVPQDKTIVIGNNDGGTGIMNNTVSVYVGTKTNSGTEADKAGLTNGTLKFINVAGNALEIPTANATTRVTNITSGTAFSLSATASTTFSRPEDGAWDPSNPSRYYFVTTDRLDSVNDGIGTQVGRTRLWRLNFTDITNPDAGGTIDLVLTGGVGNDANMWDNITVTSDGKLMLQEDVGGAAHNGKVWFYDPITNVMTKVLKHDAARFGDIVSGVAVPATAPFNNDEETSGIIDVTAMFGGNTVSGDRTYLMVDQAHYTTGISAANVEGGQLLLVHQTSGNSGPSTTQTPYVQAIDPTIQVSAILSVGDSIGGYQMAGIPDGLGAYDNNDGTFTLLMHHEIGSTLGVARAHGGIGAFVSEWVINKSTLAVVSGSDLMRNVYNWNATTQASDATTSALAFNRFCSADLPAPSAFYNAATGLGTTARLFMGGEEGGANGWAMAHVANGANKGNSYVLGKFNLSTNGSGLTGVGAWETLCANPVPQDKTIVIGNNDGGTGIMNNSVAVYVGTKTNSGTEADKAGLTNGTLKFINVAGNALEIPVANATTRVTNITSGTAFSLSATASTTFSRPEDGAWDPSNPSRYYFVTTDRLDSVNDGIGTQVGRTRLWRLNFTDIANPDAGGTIDLVINGGVGNDANMWDNITVTSDGKLMLQEDVGGAAHNGKIWFFDPITNMLTKVAKHDAARFGDIVSGIAVAATAPFNNDEETSGIIDVSNIFGSNAAAGQRAYLLVDQAHYTTGISAANVEGGQLLLMRQSPTAAFSLAATSASVLETVGTLPVVVNRYGDLQYAATVTLSTANGTAIAGTDFTALTNVAVAFAPGESSKTINLAITSRPNGQVDRSFTVALSSPAAVGVSAVLGSIATTTVTISDALVAPSDITLSASEVIEHNLANATVGTLTAVDPNAGETHTFSLVSGAGSSDNASFTIAGNVLKLTPVAHAATKASYNIRIRATDSSSSALSFEKAFIITILPQGSVSFDVSDISVNQGTTSVTLNLTRSGGSVATSVLLSTANGTATAGTDYTAINAQSISFAEGVNTATATVTLSGAIITSSLSFTATLSSIATGASIGSVPTTTVRIKADSTAPVVAITAPTAGQVIAEVPAGITVAGSLGTSGAGDSSISSVTVSINGGTPVNATISADKKTFSLAGVQPAGGLTSIVVTATDVDGNVTVSPAISFTYTVLRPLVITASTLGKVTISPALVAGKGLVGSTYSVTATPNANYFFGSWSGKPTGSAATTSFVFAAGDVVTANFVVSPFTSTIAGLYNGVIKGSTAPTDTQTNSGLISLTLTKSTGAFTGKVTLDGIALPLTGTFSQATGLVTLGNSNNGYRYDLGINLAATLPVITGSITKFVNGSPVAVLNLSAPKCYATGTSNTPPTAQVSAYNIALGTATVPAGLVASQYPAGYSTGVLTIASSGVGTLVATLADGSVMTSATSLCRDSTLPLYTSSSTRISALCGVALIDTAAVATDVTGSQVKWFRRESSGQFYPAGYGDAGLSMTLAGAKQATSSLAMLHLSTATPNATLTLEGSTLAATVVKALKISTTGAGLPALLTDKTTKLSIVAKTGVLTGSYQPTLIGTAKANATETYQLSGVIIGKGSSSDLYGHFRSPTPLLLDGSGQAGLLTLDPVP